MSEKPLRAARAWPSLENCTGQLTGQAKHGRGWGQRRQGRDVSTVGHAGLAQANWLNNFCLSVPSPRPCPSKTQSRSQHPEAAQLMSAELDGVRLPPTPPQLCPRHLTCPTMVLARTSALCGPLSISAAFRKIWARSVTGFRSHSFLAAKAASMALLSRV